MACDTFGPYQFKHVMKTFHQLPLYLIAFTFLFANTTIAQKSEKDSEDKIIRIEVEVIEDGKTEKKVEEINFENLNLNELFESLEILKDIDIDVNSEDEEIEIYIKRGKSEEDVKHYHFKVPKAPEEKGEERAFMGVYGKEVWKQYTTDDEESQGDLAEKEAESGSYVSGIVEGSGAEKAGLKKGDVIIRFDDQEVQDFKSLSTLIKANKSGDVVDVEYVRDGQKQKTKVELGAQQMKVHSYSPNWDQLGKDLGEDMEGLEEQIEKRMKHVQMMYSGDDRAFLGITNGNSEKGVEIGSVIEGSTAEKMGIQKGDQLRKIDGNSIEDFDDVLEALKAKEVGDKVAVELYRDGKKLNLEGELGSRKGYTSKGFSWISDNQQEDVIVRMKFEVADPSTKDLKQLKDKTGEPISMENDLEFKAMEFKPNPTKGRFDLKLDLIKKGETTISLYDVQGRKIFEEIIKNLDSVYEQSFDIRSEPSGIYFLNVRQGAQSMTKKIIKE